MLIVLLIIIIKNSKNRVYNTENYVIIENSRHNSINTNFNSSKIPQTYKSVIEGLNISANSGFLKENLNEVIVLCAICLMPKNSDNK